MSKRGIRDFLTDHMERLFRERLFGVKRQIAKFSIAGTDKFGALITDQVHELRRFVADRIKNPVTRPKLIEFVFSRILKDEAGSAGQACGQDVVPAITVEIVDPGEEVIGIAAPILRFWRIDLMANRKLGAFPPVGTVYDIGLAVAVQVAKASPFRKVVAGELLSFKPMDPEVFRQNPRRQSEQTG